LQEALFSSSPIDLILSIVGLALVISFPFTLTQKTQAKHFPRPLVRVISILFIWNATSILGNIFFGTTNSVPARILFGVQALAWIQAGYATNIVAGLIYAKHDSIIWKIKNL
jgi:hypothetical protein